MMANEIRMKQATLCAEVTCPDPIPATLQADLRQIGAELTARWLETAGAEGEALIDRYQALEGVLY
jgi:hypothetical protein